MTESHLSVNAKDIDISEYNYELTEDRIAQYPVSNRDLSKLLVYRNNRITDTQFCNIADHIPSDHLLVFNNTKVIRARLNFTKDSGSSIEIFCIEPLNPSDYKVIQCQRSCCMEMYCRQLKKMEKRNSSATFSVRWNQLYPLCRKT